MSKSTAPLIDKSSNEGDTAYLMAAASVNGPAEAARSNSRKRRSKRQASVTVKSRERNETNKDASEIDMLDKIAGSSRNFYLDTPEKKRSTFDKDDAGYTSDNLSAVKVNDLGDDFSSATP